MQAGNSTMNIIEEKPMITRFVSAGAAGLAITAFLIFVMNYLIEVSEAVESTPRDRMMLTFVSDIEDTKVRIEELPPEMPSPPVNPPPLVPPSAPSPEFIGVGVPVSQPAPPLNTQSPTILGTANSPLINIIAVQPNYPVSASQRGLEGHVIVVFDVTEMGTVSNVVVVESSSSIFNKAAIDAAYRFRYKARMVDGEPKASSGLQKLFRFKMEQI
jgi:protein TonB